MIEYLEMLDRSLLLFYNKLHSPVADAVMWFLSDKYVWIPLYLFIIFMMIRKAGWRGVFMILAAILTFAMTDLISVNLFKDVIQRYRPSHNQDIQHLIVSVNNYRGGLYGFVSSHAANTFGLATISYLLLQKKWFGWMIFFWAALVSFSRIYLGVHYPADIAVGALLGVACAYASWALYTVLPQNLRRAGKRKSKPSAVNP
ncbi:MAG: phosphatase PAP2 family protein [Bacteroidota bacterium]